MMCCLQTVKQVPASFTKKRLLLLRIISTLDVILLAGLYGEDIREAHRGCGVMYSHYHLFFSATPPLPCIPDLGICGSRAYSLSELCWPRVGLLCIWHLEVYFTSGLIICLAKFWVLKLDVVLVQLPRQGVGDFLNDLRYNYVIIFKNNLINSPGHKK